MHDIEIFYSSVLEAGTRSHLLDLVLSLRPHALDDSRTAYILVRNC